MLSGWGSEQRDGGLINLAIIHLLKLFLPRTGAKCLPASQIPRCRGLVLHDCHSEILAIRAFNCWLLNECHSILTSERSSPKAWAANPPESPFIQRTCEPRHTQQSTSPGESFPEQWPPFEIHPDVKIYMYCTCAPCGDASMELCMAAQGDPTPWAVATNTRPDIGGDISSKSEAPSSTPNLLNGRAYFSILGAVRRKPARADAESTLSKSCSDKLALRQVVSLLSYPSSFLVSPTENAYLAGLVLPEDEISRVACDRAFGAGKTGRMKALTGRFWSGKETSSQKHGYRFRPFEVIPLPLKEVEALWSFGKPKDAAISAKSRQKIKTGNISAVWIAAPSFRESFEMPSRKGDIGTSKSQLVTPPKTSVLETIVNGVKQGNRAMFVTSRGASVLSRAKMWGSLQNIVHLFSDNFPVMMHNDEQKADEPNNMDCPSLRWVLQASSYKDFKMASGITLAWIRLREQAMRDAKYVLQPWIHNRGDEDWNLKTLSNPNQQKEASQ